MTWQEELRQLDEDFSSGNITADEYRVRRDQVLSSAVAPQQEPPADQGGNAEATQIVSPVSPPPAQPPVQSPPPQPPQPPPSADATQIVSNAEAAGGADATQMVPPDPAHTHNPDADRTQAVPWNPEQMASPPYGVPQQDLYGPPAGQASPPYGFPQQPPAGPPSGGFPQQQQPPQEYQQPQQYEQPQQPSWHSAQSQDEATPLWGGDEFPPIAPPSEPDWVTQGPEFSKDPDEKKGSTAKIVGAVLAVLLLAGVAFGAYWLWGRGDGSNEGTGEQTSQQPPPASSETSPVPTTSEPPPDPLPIAELPGDPEEHPEVKTFEDMLDKNYFNDKEISAYEKAGAADTKFHVQHLDGGATAPLVLAEVDDGKKAKAAVKKLRDIQLGNGAEEAPKPPEGVFVTEYTNKKNAEIRAHYVSGNVIVRIEVKGKDGLKAARAAFLEVLNAQLEELPAE